MAGKFDDIRGLLIDLSGVLHDGPRAIPGSVDALHALRKAGLPLRFVSNTSRKTRKDLHAQLADLGFDLAIEEIFTAPLAARAWLERHDCQPMLLVHPDLEVEFSGMPVAHRPEDAGAVLVGDAAERFNYHELNTCFRALQHGADLLAIAKNRYFQDGDALSLDAGPFVAALEFAAGREARIFGKPNENFFRAAIDDMGLSPGEVLMVGDDVENDVNGALAAGLQAALVRTGKFREGDASRTSAGCHANLLEVVGRMAR